MHDSPEAVAAAGDAVVAEGIAVRVIGPMSATVKQELLRELQRRTPWSLRLQLPARDLWPYATILPSLKTALNNGANLPTATTVTLRVPQIKGRNSRVSITQR